jgi:hypothetical protein
MKKQKSSFETFEQLEKMVSETEWSEEAETALRQMLDSIKQRGEVTEEDKRKLKDIVERDRQLDILEVSANKAIKEASDRLVKRMHEIGRKEETDLLLLARLWLEICGSISELEAIKRQAKGGEERLGARLSPTFWKEWEELNHKCNQLKADYGSRIVKIVSE